VPVTRLVTFCVAQTINISNFPSAGASVAAPGAAILVDPFRTDQKPTCLAVVLARDLLK
jgi:hypothetical protein